MSGRFIYQDFDLLIEPGSLGSYRARVLRSPAGESTPVQFTVPFSHLELENFLLRVGQPRRGTRGPGRPESAPLKEFGGKLYDAVFQGDLRDMLQRSMSQTRAQGAGMRMRLRLIDVPELAELPWEFLYDTRHSRFLAQSRRTPLVRYLDLPDPPRPLAVEGPLRLLVMISSPSDYPPLDVENEWSLITGALAQHQADGRVVVERLAANMSTLRARLRSKECHVFHFVGHGRYRADWGDGVLVMEDRNGRSQEVTGDDLGGLLNEYDPTRLAVLNACEGARGDASDPFAGMAQSLIQQGLPAVVAMQFEITDAAAITFARELYGAIADGYPLEAALAEARGAIRDDGNPTEWGTPVLYSRAPDGQLFAVDTREHNTNAKRPANPDAERNVRDDNEVPARQDAELLRTLEDQARSMDAGGNKAAARDLFAALLAASVRILGATHPDTLGARHSLSQLTGEAGDPAAARDQLADLIPAVERVLGPEHPNTLATRQDIAYWTGEAGDVATARDILAGLVSIEERVLGSEDPNTLATRHNLAVFTMNAGDPAGARDQFAALLPVVERVLGSEDYSTLAIRGGLARSTGEAGDPSAACNQFVALLPVVERVLGPDHPDTLRARSALADWTRAAGGHSGSGEN